MDLPKYYKFGAEPADMACDLCADTGWVCEDHADRPLKDDSNRADACSFGAGRPCPRCRRDSRHVAAAAVRHARRAHPKVGLSTLRSYPAMPRKCPDWSRPLPQRVSWAKQQRN